MQFRVIPNFVASCDSFFNEFRTLAYISANQKKCRFRVVTVEKIKQLERDRRIWPIVKRDGQLARRIGAPDRPPENLRPRIHRAIRADSRRSKQRGGRRFDEPRSHAAYSRTLCIPRASNARNYHFSVRYTQT